MFMKIDNNLSFDNSTSQVIGFNYHPSKAACRLFADKWDIEEVDRDLGRIKTLGFNTIRMFLFWKDFEPEHGCYNEIAFERLREFAETARREKIYIMPTLLNGWMSGVCFDVPWRDGADLYTGKMLEAGCQYARKVAESLKDYDDVVLAYDIGNEVTVFGGHTDVQTIRKWSESIKGAIKDVCGDSLVTLGSGHDASVIDTGFGYPGHEVDFYCVHGYPLWSPFKIESIDAYKSAMYLSFMVAFGRAFGPVMLQEFGSSSSWADDKLIAQYYQRVLYSTWAAGSCGWLAWCWKDFLNCNEPYESGGLFESFCGVADVNDELKPQGEVFSQFAISLEELTNYQPVAAQTGIYIGRQYFSRGDGLSGKDNVEVNAVSMFYPYILAKRLHRNVELFNGGEWGRYKMVIVPATQTNLCWSEYDLMQRYVEEGGQLVFVNSGKQFLPPSNFMGVETMGFGICGGDVELKWQGAEYKVCLPFSEGEQYLKIETSSSAEVLCSTVSGRPLVIRQQVGRGQVVYMNLPLETSLNEVDALENDEFVHSLYEQIFDSAGIGAISAAPRNVEVVAVRDKRSGEQKHLEINHRPTQQSLVSELVRIKDGIGYSSLKDDNVSESDAVCLK
jgi:hypothetical protein